MVVIECRICFGLAFVFGLGEMTASEGAGHRGEVVPRVVHLSQAIRLCHRPIFGTHLLYPDLFIE